MVLCVDVSQADTTGADEKALVAFWGDADQQAPATKVVVRKLRRRWRGSSVVEDNDFKDVAINPRAEWQKENSNEDDLAKETITPFLFSSCGLNPLGNEEVDGGWDQQAVRISQDFHPKDFDSLR